MFKKTILLCLLLSSSYLYLQGQVHQSWPLSVAISNNATQLPSLRLFTTPVHPGITIGTEYSYNKAAKHQFFQTLNLGYVYHRYLHHAINLYTEGGYRFRTPKGFSIATKIGAGYQQEISDTHIFKTNDDGDYEQTRRLGRPQFTAGFALQPSYSLGQQKEWTIFLEYRFFIQAPFVKQYVPVLPNTVLQLGVSRMLFPSSK